VVRDPLGLSASTWWLLAFDSSCVLIMHEDDDEGWSCDAQTLKQIEDEKWECCSNSKYWKQYKMADLPNWKQSPFYCSSWMCICHQTLCH